MWQAEADTELTLSASPATAAVGELTLTLANWRYSTVLIRNDGEDMIQRLEVLSIIVSRTLLWLNFN